MTDSERYLLMEAYQTAWLNCQLMNDDEATLNGSIHAEAERWVDEVICDNGGSVGDFICHHNPHKSET